MTDAAPPTRISIIGTPGAGKTALSRTLARAHPVPRINADNLFWGPGWTEREAEPNAAFRAALRRRRTWIADGCILHGPRELLERPDLVIYLDYSAGRLVLNNLQRWLSHRKRPRPELPAGCEERFPLRILVHILLGSYRRLHERAIAACPPRRLVRLCSPARTRAFLAAFIPGQPERGAGGPRGFHLDHGDGAPIESPA